MLWGIEPSSSIAITSEDNANEKKNCEFCEDMSNKKMQILYH